MPAELVAWLDDRMRLRGWDPDEGRRKGKIDKKYGAGTYDQMAKWREEQDCLCLLCLRPEEIIRGGLVIHLMLDHCHFTGQIRGLVCSRCNQALGHFQDDPVLLRKAAEYLRRQTGEFRLPESHTPVSRS